MRINHHMAIGTVGMLPLMNWSVSGAAAFFFGSLFVDVDHNIFYVLQVGHFSFSPTRMLRLYRDWDYYGPRILLFHNYETALLALLLGLSYGGWLAYLGCGILFHLVCDQIDTYRLFRYLRIKTLVGDIMRYDQFLKADRQGMVDAYMVVRRDTWWNHLHQRLTPGKFKAAQERCSVLKLYSDVPINTSGDSDDWQKLL